VLEASAGQVLCGPLDVGRLCQIEAPWLRHLNLLHIVIATLHLVSIIVQILLTTPDFLLVQRRIDPNLIRKNRLIFPMLNVSNLH
jgi:hypothetical protein